MADKTKSGWIKTYRSIQEHWIWRDNEPFDSRSAWIDLILLANHEDTKIYINGQLLNIRRGQHFTSLYKLAERWHWSRNKVRRYLDTLEGDGMVTRDATHNGTLLTLVNYGLFQGGQTTDGTTDGTTKRLPAGLQTDYGRDANKNDKELLKNDKEVKNIAPPSFGGEWQ